MKRPNTPRKMEIRSLDNQSLEKASGGRGSFCGTLIHCDCGYAWTKGSASATQCPSCGASTGLADDGGGGGGGGGGDCGRCFNEIAAL